MYQFIRIQYLMGRITADQVRAFAHKYITTEEAEAILSQA